MAVSIPARVKLRCARHPLRASFKRPIVGGPASPSTCYDPARHSDPQARILEQRGTRTLARSVAHDEGER